MLSGRSIATEPEESVEPAGDTVYRGGSFIATNQTRLSFFASCLIEKSLSIPAGEVR